MTAEEVKEALRRRHPGETFAGRISQWTTLEEWRGIDLLALSAWRSADVVGYEVKVSRGDLRRELLKPYKREAAVRMTTEFYFAVPEGLLTEDEIAFREPEWRDEDFERMPCPGVPGFGTWNAGYSRPLHSPYGGRCSHRKDERGRHVSVPFPEVIIPPRRSYQKLRVPCWVCDGKGYLELSRVEREAPVVWIPKDVGLITVSEKGWCREVRKSPRRKHPEPIAKTRKQINVLARWISHRPDPRHR